MTTNIEVIRAAEAQLPQLQQQIQTLRQEALADDGQIDPEEQAGIDRVQTKITDLERLITERRSLWEANKASYETLLASLQSDLTEITDCSDENLQQDRARVLSRQAQMEQVAATQDYATALEQATAVQSLAADFLSQQEQRAENARLAEMSNEELAEADLTGDMLDEVFTEDYMEALAENTFDYLDRPVEEGQPTLPEVMRTIEGGVTGPERAETMAHLARLVGDPPSPSDLDADYGRFLIIKRQQASIGTQNSSGAVPALDEERHEEFRGSHAQLTFGKVLGDTFEIHEVFASLLSPTGGLVGPGNNFGGPFEDAFHLAPDNPVGLHGTVHDAAGYLKSYHDEGPGYNYREDPYENVAEAIIMCFSEDVQREYLPYTGQISGIAYWWEEKGDEFVDGLYDDALAELDRALGDAQDCAAREVAEMIGRLDAAKTEAEETVAELRQEALDRAAEAEEDFHDFVEEVQHEVQDFVNEAQEDFDDFTDAAETEIIEVQQAFGDALDRAQDTAVEAYEEASAEFRAFSESASEKLGALGSLIWS